MTSPFVTVVTPVHNGERHLAECIESVIAQTFERWEYLIADNCSDDGTAEIALDYARRDSRVRHVRSEAFVDVISSYNRAVDLVDHASPYCKIVGADDHLEPRCLERMVALAECNPSVGIVGAHRLKGPNVDLDNLTSSQSIFPGREIVRRSLLKEISVLGSPTSLLYRRRLLDEGGGSFLEPSFRHGDTDAAYRLLMGSDFGMVHEVLTRTRLSESGEGGHSDRLNSTQAERILRLLRYGPQVLSEDEFRSQLRLELRTYRRWHYKQRLRPSRIKDAEFRRYHGTALELMAAEAGSVRDVGTTVGVLRALW